MAGHTSIAGQFVVTNLMGLNVRCARRLAQTARQFEAACEVTYRGAVSDGKSLPHLLTLGVSCGEAVQVGVYGGDAPRAFEAIQQLFQQAFGTAAAPEGREKAVARC